MKYIYALMALCAAIFLIDLLVSHVQEWQRERKRQRNIARFAMSPFRGVKHSDRWMS